ncbi:UvrD-helicase domain-containing protein [Tissierella sp. Yu-01]|uniref:UvrD-helicase domain-containing protein n=1 Tax=Tissierella sp. Yu-01 TaxID=3035694 RepID=UPI00240E1F7C|nr:UvrD-helicase domain-containing protein [Tissierella sp. Yu-01]WFA08912.1 UvrD-helicase domain-containing protein [Tissierella sp. Yu-01]
MDFLAGLNDRQKEAVLHTEGPLLIMAGAGSGKTRVVTHKIAYLIEEKNIYPGNILAITFTNKAAAEMKTRLYDLLNMDVDRMWMGTFHSICVRMLRRDIDKIGYDRSFTIYDRDDQITLIKECMKEVNVDKDMYKESSLLARISSLKDQQMDPDTFINMNYNDFRERNIGEIYALYQKKLKAYNALDFDDLLIKAVELLAQNKDILDYYQKKFQYIFVDEYQDTNKIQYKLVRLLSAWHKNICVVGDSDQCVVEGMKVNTPNGEVNIEDLKVNDQVYSAAGQGEVTTGIIDFVKKSPYKGPIISIKTETGKTLKLTPNHILFSKLNPEQGVHYVYLMYKKQLGYRIGQTQGVRAYEKGKVLNGLEVRMNQEHGDKAWILKVCTSKEEASYYEMLYSLKYSIPTLVFHPKGRNMTFNQEYINRFFSEIDTRKNVVNLMDDLMVFEEYPVVRQGAVIRKDTFRRIVNLTFFGGRIVGNNAGWYSHRINLNTSGEELREKANSFNFNTRKGKNNTWRIETERTNYDEAERFSNEIIALEDNLEINKRARLLKDTVFNFTPASHVKSTMSIAIFNNGEIIEDVVKQVDIEDYDGFVYDISVPNLRQYVCEGIVVHNSIYSWRGADISNILDFEEDFPGAKVILLEQNYRSTQSILNVANKVIKKNNSRKDKNLWTDNSEGDVVIYEQCDYSEEEAFFVAKKIHEFIYKGYKPSDIAILYRTNVQSRTFEEIFMTENLPYKIVGGLKFYDRKEVKDLIAYLKFVQNPNDNISLKRIINTPRRGIGNTTLDKIEQYAALTGDSMYGVLLSIEHVPGLTGRAINSIKPFVELMNRFMAMKEIMGIKEFIEEIINSSGYVAELEKENTIESKTRIENIKDFLSVALTFEEKNEDANMEDFLASISLLSDVDKTVDTDNLITMMTVHSAKGLEFPIVFLVGMEEGLFPISRALDNDDDLEEERRLCYVAVTRAEKHLFITNAKKRTIYGSTNYTMPSRFLDEMGDSIEQTIKKAMEVSKLAYSRQEEKLINVVDYDESRFTTPKPTVKNKAEMGIEVGTKVKHKKWGIGTVVMIKTRDDGDKELTIAFDEEGLKKLLQSIAPIKVV